MIGRSFKDKSGSLLNEIADYYSKKLAIHNETPQGVDWNGEKSQVLRFRQLCKIFESNNSFSLNDLGCGYGALFDFLLENYSLTSYLGIDVSDDMIMAANRRYENYPETRFIRAAEPDEEADYGIASGIFNVRLCRSDSEWSEHLESTLDSLDRTSRRGFAFNCLTSYSDQDKKRNYLYYPDPCFVFDICKRRFSKQVALLHDYGLYEFTILVRKS